MTKNKQYGMSNISDTVTVLTECTVLATWESMEGVSEILQ